MALSKDFEKWKGGCPSRYHPGDIPKCSSRLAFHIPDGTEKTPKDITVCSFEHCAVLYWLKHAFIDSNPGDVEF